MTALGVDIFQKQNRKFINNKKGKTNFYTIKTDDSIICGYFCTVFIGFMLKGNHLLDYTNSFSPNEYENNDKIILKCFEKLHMSVENICQEFRLKNILLNK